MRKNKHSDGVDDPELIKGISKKYKGIIEMDKIEQVCCKGSSLGAC